MPLNFDVMHVLHFWCAIVSTASFGIACLAYDTAIHFALYQQPLYPEFIVNRFNIKRAAATFAQFACTLRGKHKENGGLPDFVTDYQIRHLGTLARVE